MRRLNVIVPPGLVAASKVAQAGGGGGGGMQSIGLGSVANREGAFGEFQAERGGRRTALGPADRRAALTRPWPSPPGRRRRLRSPASASTMACRPRPPRDTLTVMDVDTYTTDPRIRKALRTLATLGTSHGVAQAVMWRLCNDLSFETMIEQSGKVMNLSEIALAARFVEALDESTSAGPLEPSALTESRILVQVEGQGPLARDARGFSGQLEGLRVLGLPLKVVEGETLPPCSAPAMGLGHPDRRQDRRDPRSDRGHRLRRAERLVRLWATWPSARIPRSPCVDGPTLARAIDRAFAGAFVSVKPARRAVGQHDAEGREPPPVHDLERGRPGRKLVRRTVGAVRGRRRRAGPVRPLPIQAATASLVEHVELNGL